MELLTTGTCLHRRHGRWYFLAGAPKRHPELWGSRSAIARLRYRTPYGRAGGVILHAHRHLIVRMGFRARRLPALWSTYTRRKQRGAAEAKTTSLCLCLHPHPHIRSLFAHRLPFQDYDGSRLTIGLRHCGVAHTACERDPTAPRPPRHTQRTSDHGHPAGDTIDEMAKFT